MKKTLSNGLVLVLKNTGSNSKEISLTFKCGHVNEPKLGLAAVYEKIVQRNAENIASVCGGSMTSFAMSVKSSVTIAMKKLYDTCVNPAITPQALKIVISDIIKHTRDLAPLPKRQTKLAYKHTAFGKNDVYWDTEEYIAKVAQLTTDDVKAYITDNFVGSNIVIGYCGSKEDFGTFIEVAEKYFGSLEKGKRKSINLEYTGGFQKIQGNGNMQLAFFGWDLSYANSTAETNVLMSLLSGRLERSLGEAHIPAESEVKIAGYFGLRTLRISVSCLSIEDFNKCIDIVCRNVRRLQNSVASDRRMETSRQRAMAERLGVSNEAMMHSVKIAWSTLGRDVDYDTDAAISNIWEVSAHDVQMIAQDIFSQKMTCVLYTNDSSARSQEEIIQAMNPAYTTAPDKQGKEPELSDYEKKQVELIDNLNAE